MYKCIIKNYFNIGNKKNDEFTITEMATYCNVSRQTITNILENKKEPKISLAILITDFINEKLKMDWHVEVEDIFKIE